MSTILKVSSLISYLLYFPVPSLSMFRGWFGSVSSPVGTQRSFLLLDYPLSQFSVKQKKKKLEKVKSAAVSNFAVKGAASLYSSLSKIVQLKCFYQPGVE